MYRENSTAKKSPSSNIGKGLEKTNLQRKYTTGQRVHAKILNITNQTQTKHKMKHYLIPIKMTTLKKQKISGLVRMWRNWNLCALLVKT